MKNRHVLVGCAVIAANFLAVPAYGAPTQIENLPIGDGWSAGHMLSGPGSRKFDYARLRAFEGDLQCDASALSGNALAANEQVAKLLAAEPGNTYAWLANAEVKLRAVNLDCGCGYGNARDASDKAISMAPDNPAVYLTATRIDLADSDVYRAKEDVRLARIHGASEYDLAYAGAMIAQRQHDDKANIQLLAPIVENIEQSTIKAMAYEKLGDSYLSQNQLDSAEKMYRSGANVKACVSSPQQSFAQFLLFEKSDSDGARAALQELLRRLPSTETKRLLSLADYYSLAKNNNLSQKQRSALKVLAQSAYAGPEDVFIEVAKFKSGLALMKNLSSAGMISNIDARDGKNNTALISAAIGSNLSAAEFLLSKHAAVDAENAFGRRALDLFAANGNVEAVKLLLKNHADSDYGDKNGDSPLSAAVTGGYADVVDILLKSRTAFANTKISTLLSQAILMGNKDITRLLLNGRVNVNESTNDAVPPLIAAILSHNAEIVKLLIDKKADTEIRYRGKSATDYARSTGDHTIIQLVERTSI